LSGIFVADGKNEKKEEKKQNKKTSVKHIRIRLIGGCVNEGRPHSIESLSKIATAHRTQ